MIVPIGVSDDRNFHTIGKLEDKLFTDPVDIEYPKCLAVLGKSEAIIVLKFEGLAFKHIITSPFL